MGPNLERLIQYRSDALRSPREQEMIRTLRRLAAAGQLDSRRRAVESEVSQLIAAVRADPRDPFRTASDEEIAGELLRRLSR